MRMHQQLLDFWQALIHLRNSKEVGDRLERFAHEVFPDIVSVQLYALEETPGNPRVLRGCGGAAAGEAYAGTGSRAAHR